MGSLWCAASPALLGMIQKFHLTCTELNSSLGALRLHGFMVPIGFCPEPSMDTASCAFVLQSYLTAKALPIILTAGHVLFTRAGVLKLASFKLAVDTNQHPAVLRVGECL